MTVLSHTVLECFGGHVSRPNGRPVGNQLFQVIAPIIYHQIFLSSVLHNFLCFRGARPRLGCREEIEAGTAAGDGGPLGRAAGQE